MAKESKKQKLIKFIWLIVRFNISLLFLIFYISLILAIDQSFGGFLDNVVRNYVLIYIYVIMLMVFSSFYFSVKLFIFLSFKKSDKPFRSRMIDSIKTKLKFFNWSIFLTFYVLCCSYLYEKYKVVILEKGYDQLVIMIYIMIPFVVPILLDTCLVKINKKYNNQNIVSNDPRYRDNLYSIVLPKETAALALEAYLESERSSDVLGWGDFYEQSDSIKSAVKYGADRFREMSYTILSEKKHKNVVILTVETLQYDYKREFQRLVNSVKKQTDKLKVVKHLYSSLEYNKIIEESLYKVLYEYFESVSKKNLNLYSIKTVCGKKGYEIYYNDDLSNLIDCGVSEAVSLIELEIKNLTID